MEEIRSGLAYREGRRQTEWFERFLDERCEVLPVAREIARRAAPVTYAGFCGYAAFRGPRPT